MKYISVLILFFISNSLHSQVEKYLTQDELIASDSIIIYELVGSCTYDNIAKYVLTWNTDLLVLEKYGDPERTKKSQQKIKYWRIFDRRTGRRVWINFNELVDKKDNYAVFLEKETNELPIQYLDSCLNVIISSEDSSGWYHNYEVNLYLIETKDRTRELSLRNNWLGQQINRLVVGEKYKFH